MSNELTKKFMGLVIRGLYILIMTSRGYDMTTFSVSFKVSMDEFEKKLKEE